MDIDIFCNMYQRKMWKSMITRKKLHLDIWDLIQTKKENVYYMPYGSKHKFSVITGNCLKCAKKLNIGFRHDEFVVDPCKCSSDGKNYATIEKLTTLFSENDAVKILKAFASAKTRKLPNRLQYWIDHGYSLDQAKQKVIEVQTNRSNKSPSSKPGAKGYSPRTVEYWTKKGMTITEAKEKISKLQIRNGLKWYIDRYGAVHGAEKYATRMKKWKKSYLNALQNDPSINERKMVSFSKASKQSLNIFLPVYNKYKNKLKMYLGIDGSQEYFLRDDKKISYYDFTIPSLKLIFEFNGSKFHPNQDQLTEEEFIEWKSLFSNQSAADAIISDEMKRKLAEMQGFDVIIIWDTDNIEDSVRLIENLIEEKLNEF